MLGVFNIIINVINIYIIINTKTMIKRDLINNSLMYEIFDFKKGGAINE